LMPGSFGLVEQFDALAPPRDRCARRVERTPLDRVIVSTYLFNKGSV